MKFEFIKEEKINGTTIYYTRVDGRFIDGSLELTEEKARLRFDFLVENKTTEPVETVLDSIETE